VLLLTLALACPALAEPGVPLEDLIIEAPPAPPAAEEIEVVGELDPSAPTEHVVPVADLARLPGSAGDMVRAIQNLPGLARPPFGLGQLMVRGTAPEDSAFYVDGAPVPLVFHFGGLSTVINGDVLDEVHFLPGAYGVRFGRTLGGVVDLSVRESRPEATEGYVSVDLFQAALYTAVPVHPRWSFRASARRSYIDAILDPILDRRVGPTRAPRYYDGQVQALYTAPSNTSISTLFFASNDAFSTVGNEEDGGIGVALGFVRGQVSARTDLGAGVSTATTVAVGSEGRDVEIEPDGDAFDDATTYAIRSELHRGVRDWLGWRLGIDFIGEDRSYRYIVPTFGALPGGSGTAFAPAGYGEVTLAAGMLLVTPGIRGDAQIVDNGSSSAAFDPRLTVLLDLGQTELTASTGRYSRLPRLRKLVGTEGNPDLGAQWSWSTSVGLTQHLSPWTSVQLAGYTMQLRKLIVGREDTFNFDAPALFGPLDMDPWANEGRGNSMGAEALLKVGTERTFVWIAASLSRSVRVDRVDGPRSLFAWDQPVQLTALASQELPKTWHVGARARLSSGIPYTPIVNRVYDLDQRTYTPIYGAVDSARLPPYWALDFRVDKEWTFRRAYFTLYLDLLNATNHRNVDLMSWNHDLSEERPVFGLPILPAFGLKAGW
jgi:hypothetical protein